MTRVQDLEINSVFTLRTSIGHWDKIILRNESHILATRKYVSSRIAGMQNSRKATPYVIITHRIFQSNRIGFVYQINTVTQYNYVQ